MDNPSSEERSTAELFLTYAALLWHWAWVLLLTAALGRRRRLLALLQQTPIYQASTTVSVNVAPASPTITASALSTSEQLAATYAQEMVMQPVLDGVAQRLNLPAFPHSANVQVTPVNNTQLLKIVVQDVDPTRAALIANTLLGVFSDKIQADQASRYASSKTSLQTQMAALDQNNQDAAAAVTAMNKQIQETTNTLTTVSEKIQSETAIPPTTGISQLLVVPQETIDADKNRRDQLQITLVQYNPNWLSCRPPRPSTSSPITIYSKATRAFYWPKPSLPPASSSRVPPCLQYPRSAPLPSRMPPWPPWSACMHRRRRRFPGRIPG